MGGQWNRSLPFTLISQSLRSFSQNQLLLISWIFPEGFLCTSTYPWTLEDLKIACFLSSKPSNKLVWALKIPQHVKIVGYITWRKEKPGITEIHCFHCSSAINHRILSWQMQTLNASRWWPERAVCTNDKRKGRKAAKPFTIPWVSEIPSYPAQFHLVLQVKLYNRSTWFLPRGGYSDRMCLLIQLCKV